MALKQGNVSQFKTGSITYADPGTTVAKTVFTLPSNAMITDVKVFGVASDDTGAATLTFKNVPFDGVGTPATFAVADVKTAISVVTGFFGKVLSGISYARQSAPQQITVTYTGANGNAAAGSWSFVVEYI